MTPMIITNILAASDNPFGAPTGDQILLWLACAWVVMSAAGKGTDLWARWTGKSPLGTPANPVHNRASEQVPTWAEIAALDKRVITLEEGMREMTAAGERRANRLMAAQAESAGKLHSRIYDILKAVSRLEGKMEK